MTKVFGANESLIINDAIDMDDELEINIHNNNPVRYTADEWINKEDAKEIIKHLQNVFKLQG